MIAAHIDEMVPKVIEEIEDFETENGRVSEIIQFEHLRCTRCFAEARQTDVIRYVITARGQIVWWHQYDFACYPRSANFIEQEKV